MHNVYIVHLYQVLLKRFYTSDNYENMKKISLFLFSVAFLVVLSLGQANAQMVSFTVDTGNFSLIEGDTQNITLTFTGITLDITTQVCLNSGETIGTSAEIADIAMFQVSTDDMFDPMEDVTLGMNLQETCSAEMTISSSSTTIYVRLRAVSDTIEEGAENVELVVNRRTSIPPNPPIYERITGGVQNITLYDLPTVTVEQGVVFSLIEGERLERSFTFMNIPSSAEIPIKVCLDVLQGLASADIEDIEAFEVGRAQMSREVTLADSLQETCSETILVQDSTELSITITATDDQRAESSGSETFALRITSSSSSDFIIATQNITIYDAPTIDFIGNFNILEDDTQSITVRFISIPTGGIQVDVCLQSATGPLIDDIESLTVEGVDVIPLTATEACREDISISDTTLTLEVSITAKDDALNEGAESFPLIVRRERIGADDAETQQDIILYDAPTVEFTGTFDLLEGDTQSITVQLSGLPIGGIAIKVCLQESTGSLEDIEVFQTMTGSRTIDVITTEVDILGQDEEICSINFISIGQDAIILEVKSDENNEGAETIQLVIRRERTGANDVEIGTQDINLYDPPTVTFIPITDVTILEGDTQDITLALTTILPEDTTITVCLKEQPTRTSPAQIADIDTFIIDGDEVTLDITATQACSGKITLSARSGTIRTLPVNITAAIDQEADENIDETLSLVVTRTVKRRNTSEEITIGTLQIIINEPEVEFTSSAPLAGLIDRAFNLTEGETQDIRLTFSRIPSDFRIQVCLDRTTGTEPIGVDIERFIVGEAPGSTVIGEGTTSTGTQACKSNITLSSGVRVLNVRIQPRIDDNSPEDETFQLVVQRHQTDMIDPPVGIVGGIQNIVIVDNSRLAGSFIGNFTLIEGDTQNIIFMLANRPADLMIRICLRESTGFLEDLQSFTVSGTLTPIISEGSPPAPAETQACSEDQTVVSSVVSPSFSLIMSMTVAIDDDLDEATEMLQLIVQQKTSTDSTSNTDSTYENIPGGIRNILINEPSVTFTVDPSLSFSLIEGDQQGITLTFTHIPLGDFTIRACLERVTRDIRDRSISSDIQFLTNADTTTPEEICRNISLAASETSFDIQTQAVIDEDTDEGPEIFQLFVQRQTSTNNYINLTGSQSLTIHEPIVRLIRRGDTSPIVGDLNLLEGKKQDITLTFETIPSNFMVQVCFSRPSTEPLIDDIETLTIDGSTVIGVGGVTTGTETSICRSNISVSELNNTISVSITAKNESNAPEADETLELRVQRQKTGTADYVDLTGGTQNIVIQNNDSPTVTFTAESFTITESEMQNITLTVNNIPSDSTIKLCLRRTTGVGGSLSDDIETFRIESTSISLTEDNPTEACGDDITSVNSLSSFSVSITAKDDDILEGEEVFQLEVTRLNEQDERIATQNILIQDVQASVTFNPAGSLSLLEGDTQQIEVMLDNIPINVMESIFVSVCLIKVAQSSFTAIEIFEVQSSSVTLDDSFQEFCFDLPEDELLPVSGSISPLSITIQARRNHVLNDQDRAFKLAVTGEVQGTPEITILIQDNVDLATAVFGGSGLDAIEEIPPISTQDGTMLENVPSSITLALNLRGTTDIDIQTCLSRAPSASTPESLVSDIEKFQISTDSMFGNANDILIVLDDTDKVCSKTISITTATANVYVGILAKSDTLVEGPEAFILQITEITSMSNRDLMEQQVVVLDADLPTVELSLSPDFLLTEGETTELTVSLELPEGTSLERNWEVVLRFIGNTPAVRGLDLEIANNCLYDTENSQLTVAFLASAIIEPVICSITATADRLLEGSEEIELQLQQTTPDGYRRYATDQENINLVIQIRDNNAPSWNISGPDKVVEGTQAEYTISYDQNLEITTSLAITLTLEMETTSPRDFFPTFESLNNLFVDTDLVNIEERSPLSVQVTFRRDSLARSVSFSLGILDDRRLEGPESYILKIHTPQIGESPDIQPIPAAQAQQRTVIEEEPSSLPLVALSRLVSPLILRVALPTFSDVVTNQVTHIFSKQTRRTPTASRQRFHISFPGVFLNGDNNQTTGDTQQRNWDVWVSGVWTGIKAGEGVSITGSMINIWSGIDYLVNDWLLVGTLLGYEGSTMDVEALDGRMQGTGLSGGGYVGMRYNNLVLNIGGVFSHIDYDARALDQFGEFSAQRAMASAALTGQYSLGSNFFIEPSLRGFFGREWQDAYIDSFQNTVKRQKFTFGRVTFGPKIHALWSISEDFHLKPFLEIRGEYDFYVDTPPVTVPGIEEDTQVYAYISDQENAFSFERFGSYLRFGIQGEWLENLSFKLEGIYRELGQGTTPTLSTSVGLGYRFGQSTSLQISTTRDNQSLLLDTRLRWKF